MNASFLLYFGCDPASSPVSSYIIHHFSSYVKFAALKCFSVGGVHKSTTSSLLYFTFLPTCVNIQPRKYICTPINIKIIRWLIPLSTSILGMEIQCLDNSSHRRVFEMFFCPLFSFFSFINLNCCSVIFQTQTQTDFSTTKSRKTYLSLL